MGQVVGNLMWSELECLTAVDVLYSCMNCNLLV